MGLWEIGAAGQPTAAHAPASPARSGQAFHVSASSSVAVAQYRDHLASIIGAGAGYVPDWWRQVSALVPPNGWSRLFNAARVPLPSGAPQNLYTLQLAIMHGALVGMNNLASPAEVQSMLYGVYGLAAR